MPPELLEDSQLILVLAAILTAAMLLEVVLQKLRVHPMLGFLAIGVALRALNESHGFLSEEGIGTLELLAQLGVICLLFRVGLDSDVAGLFKQLPRAVFLWVGNVGGAVVAAWIACRYVCGLEVLPSLFVTVAFSATSVAVGTAIWSEMGALRGRRGALLVDVAELDDVSAVLGMVLLFTAVPVLLDTGAEDGALMQELLPAMGDTMLKLLGFVAVCVLFLRFVEKRLTWMLQRLDNPPDRMLGIVGAGMMIAAFAGWLGFSVAIGALFAGLMFARDPAAVRVETQLETLLRFFLPFFFVSVGHHIQLEVLLGAVGLGLPLLAAAVLGKFLGTYGPMRYLGESRAVAAVFSASMVPRAEIALFIVAQGHRLGDEVVPGEVYAAVVLVAAVTCVAAPLALPGMLVRSGMGRRAPGWRQRRAARRAAQGLAPPTGAAATDPAEAPADPQQAG